jgi:tetratricopeptide (TPR) repeat protein
MENFLLKYVALKTHSAKALVFGLILEVISFASIDGFVEKILPDVNIRFLLYSVVLLLWVLYWLHYKFCLPKNTKKKVGLVIAVYAESNHEEKRLKADLISQLQKSILDQGFGDTINVIVLKNHISEKIKSTKDINDVHKKVKGHFYLYGRVKRRNNGQNTYFLDLDGMVVHRPVDIRLSSALAQDFITILPKQVSFFESIEFKGFQFTANIVYLAVKYITGVAAYLSGDPHLAIKLHSNLRDEFNQFRPLPPNLQKIRDKATLLLSDEELLIARRYYFANDFTNADLWLQKCFATNPNNYGGFLLKAIKEFQIDKNPKTALLSIKNAKKYSKATSEWRYSEAFLKFWIEDYPSAIKSCEKIANGSYFGEEFTVAEVEDFNKSLLSDPNLKKPQLYFWLGYLNYKKKDNLPQSLKYFEEFEKNNEQSLVLLRQKSSPYLREIKKRMGLS